MTLTQMNMFGVNQIQKGGDNMSEVKVHTITRPVWEMTGGEKRKYTQKDHPEFLLDIVLHSDYLAEKNRADEAVAAEKRMDEIIIKMDQSYRELQLKLTASENKVNELDNDVKFWTDSYKNQNEMGYELSNKIKVLDAKLAEVTVSSARVFRSMKGQEDAMKKIFLDQETQIKVLEAKLAKAIPALEEIANDQEESSHERAENALWAAKSALKAIKAITELTTNKRL